MATLGDGRFTLHSMLGEGGMARVYRAYDHRLRRWRAIKMLLPEFAGRASVRRRFEAEAQALAVLEHPHVVRIYDVGGSASESYIIMELCEGGAVGDWMLEHGRMPARMAVEVAMAMADGMQAAHEAGIIHRDLKPGNLLIDRRGTIKVTDFGIARTDAVSTTRTGSSMGTIGYMAPEQNDNAKGVDARTDVYALGATLYTLVTGNTDPHLFTVDREPGRLDDVPQALRPVIQRAVAFSPADRYPSMQAVAQALSAVRAQLPDMDPGTPPLLQHTPMDVQPPPAPLTQQQQVKPVVVPRATVPDITPGPPPTDPPMSGLVEFEMPADAPEPFLTMTPGTVQRTGRPTPASASRKRFDDLYVTDEESNKPEDDRYVGTMVGWKPKSRDRADVDRAARDGEAPLQAAHGARVAWFSGLERLVGFRALGLGLIAGAAFLLLVGGSIYVQSMAGADAIESQRQSYWSASQRFHERIEADPVLPQDLTQHGADSDVLMDAMATYRSAGTREERREAAEALAALMSAEYSVLELQDKLSASARADLGPRVRGIQAERSAVDDARTRWQSAAETFGGGWALRLGTATPAVER